jgi:hypothetical protein
MKSHLYKTAMSLSRWAIVIIATCLIGCETAHNIGRTLTAPVRYVINEPEPTAAASASDVTNPGRPVAVPTATPRSASRKSKPQSASAPSRVTATKPSAKSSPSSQKSTSATQFPVAKPVPGKPGLVFNPFNAGGGYIDVSGYAPGSKVKDPDSKQIFVVP